VHSFLFIREKKTRKGNYYEKKKKRGENRLRRVKHREKKGFIRLFGRGEGEEKKRRGKNPFLTA